MWTSELFAGHDSGSQAAPEVGDQRRAGGPSPGALLPPGQPSLPLCVYMKIAPDASGAIFMYTYVTSPSHASALLFAYTCIQLKSLLYTHTYA